MTGPPEHEQDTSERRDLITCGGNVVGGNELEPQESASEPTDVSPSLAPSPLDVLERIRQRTPARILAGRAGSAYRTSTLLDLRRDHAIARDAICTEFDLTGAFGVSIVAEWGLFEVATLARTKQDFLLHPHLGRTLEPAAWTELSGRCPLGVDFQVAIADGLSAQAVSVQVPALLPLLAARAQTQGWQFGQPFFIRHGRVGVLNDIGEILNPTVAVLLIGERPGLATAESLSAYMAYRPRAGDDDARRNLISNIHSRGSSPSQATDRIVRLAVQMIQHATSGVAIKEQGPLVTSLPAQPADNANADS